MTAHELALSFHSHTGDVERRIMSTLQEHVTYTAKRFEDIGLKLLDKTDGKSATNYQAWFASAVILAVNVAVGILMFNIEKSIADAGPIEYADTTTH